MWTLCKDAKMSLINMQDNVIKSSLVQQVQSRGGDIAKAAEMAQNLFKDELARQADETVKETPQTENGVIHDDQEREQGGKPPRRRRQRRHGEESEDESTEQGDGTPPSPDGPHRIDLTV